MLLLLISLFSNYDLFHCNQVGQANFNKTLSAQMHRSIREIDILLRDFQQEIQKQKSVLRTVDLEDNLKDDGLLDYSVTPMWWGGTPKVNQIGRKNSAITLLPIPVGHGMTNSSEDKDPQHTTHTKNLWENLNPLPGVQLNSSSGPFDVDYPLSQPPFTFPTFPPLTTLPPLDPYYLNFFYASSISFTRPTYPFFVPPRTAPSPSPVAARDREAYLVGSASTWIGPLKPIRLTRPPNDPDIPTTTVAVTKSSQTTTRVSTLFPRPPLSLPVLRGPFTSNPKTSTTFNFFTIWKRVKERTDYTPTKRITKADRTTLMIHRPQQIGRTLSKAQAWVRNRQWTKTSKAARTNKGTTKEVLRVPDLLTTASDEEISGTAFTGSLFQEDAQGFLYVTIPTVISTAVTSPPTAAGDVLHFAKNYTRRPGSAVDSPNQVYHKLIDEWDEGYMVVFLRKIFLLISVKNHSEVRDVLYHSEFINNGFEFSNQIYWVGDRIMKIASMIFRFCSEESAHNMKKLRTFAAMFNQMLEERDTALSDEVNSIIDSADLMYEDEEGEALFDALREFEEYPNGTKTSREICLNLMMTFMKPYTRLKEGPRCQRLLNQVDRALIKRFGERRANEELPTLGGAATTTANHSIERKQIHNSLKRRISIKRHLINRTKHHDSNEDTYRRQLIPAAEYQMLRSNLPITRHQKRFRVITPRQLRLNAYLNIERPTQDYFYRRLGRTIHPPNGMLQFFPQATKESENKRRMQPIEVTQHLQKSQKRSGRMKAKLIRRIVEDSSYSDEEALLKLNLQPQMRTNGSLRKMI